MPGIGKEVQKHFGKNVQDYIIASRAAQGYENWLDSSDAEKEDVVVRWKRLQQHSSKNRTSDEIVQDVRKVQRKKNVVGTESH